MHRNAAMTAAGTRPALLRLSALLRMVLLCLCLPAAARAQFNVQYGLKPRLYTSGSSVRRAFSDVTEQARQSTVEIVADKQVRALGVIVGADGWVLTKSSETTAQPLTVRLADAQEFPAEVVGRHDATDLALLKINARELTPIEWEPQPETEVGQWIITSGLRSTPQAIGVVSTARRSVKAERESGVLGVGLDGDEGPPTVTRVFPNSGADVAGLKAGDVIEQINGKRMTGRVEMIKLVQEHSPGDALSLLIRRAEEKLEVKVTLTPPISDEFRSRIAVQNRMGGELSRRRNGFEAVIQHDSVLRPEECGGPAITLSGKAIGVNIARAGRTESYALPADLVIPVIDELKLNAPTSTVSKD